MNELAAKLGRAELITHLVQVDPAAGAEAEVAARVLRAAERKIFRIEPYCYGVDLGPDGDAAGAAERLGAALAGLDGAGDGAAAVALTPVARARTAPAPMPGEGVSGDPALLLLGEIAGAADGLAAADQPHPLALISAEFAVRTAELTAERLARMAEPAPAELADQVADRLALRLEAGADMLRRLAEEAGRIAANRAVAALEARLGGLETALAAIGELSRAADLRARLEALGASEADLGPTPAAAVRTSCPACADPGRAPWAVSEAAIAELAAGLAGVLDRLDRLDRLVAAPGERPAPLLPHALAAELAPRLDALETGTAAAIDRAVERLRELGVAQIGSAAETAGALDLIRRGLAELIARSDLAAEAAARPASPCAAAPADAAHG